jgi:putative transposase
MTGNEKSTDRGLSLAERKALRTKGCLSNRTALAMVFKLLEAAQKSWRRLDGTNQLPKLVLGVTFNNGIEVIAKPTDRQPTTAAA